MVSYMGFDTLQIPITIKSNDLITKKLYLKKSTFTLEEVNISAAKENKKVEIQTSIIKITPKEIGQIPSIGGNLIWHNTSRYSPVSYFPVTRVGNFNPWRPPDPEQSIA